MINLARDYSTKRVAFGKLLKDYPLHMATLSNMEVCYLEIIFFSTCFNLG